MRNKLSFFKGARNIGIKDSSLTVNVDTSKQNKLDRLLDEVAPNAILNAGGRADEVRCHPGTREEVISKVEKWMDGRGEPYHRVMWLSGPAGAGKSAIVQTVAERCQERGTHTANFFFFRGDGTRNHAKPLVPTLVYQLLDLYPALSNRLTEHIAAKPLAYKASTEEQFIRLIFAPIQIMQHSSLIHQPIILMIDGLDECDDERKQEKILGALHELVEDNDSPFRVLVASRAEPHLVMSFNKIGTSVESIFLDDEYRPQDDIRRFVIAKFDEIKRVHSLARTLGEHWPTSGDIDAITDKSSGQFIYAATVMRFIEYSPANPAVSLLRIHGLRPATDHSPLAGLDAVYSYIFSKIPDLRIVKLVLGAHVIMRNRNPELFQSLAQRGGYNTIEIESFLAGLAPILKFVPGPPMNLVFYHASLSDYLADQSRSGVYFVGVGAIAAEWASVCLNKWNDFYSWACGVALLERVQNATPELSQSLLNASQFKLKCNGAAEFSFVTGIWQRLLVKIFDLYAEADTELYKRMLRRWIRFAYMNNIDVGLAITGPFTSDPISTYYAWYSRTEGLKSALRLHT